MYLSIRRAASILILTTLSLSASASMEFKVDNSLGLGLSPGSGTQFTASNISGTYNEVVVVTELVPVPKFQATVLLSFTSFNIFPNTSGLTTDYGLYAVVNIAGEVTDPSNFPASITTGNWSGDLAMYLDVDTDTNSFDSNKMANVKSAGELTSNATSNLNFTAAELDDDLMLLSGNINQGGSTGSLTNGGYSLSSNSVNLTAAGQQFFVEPVPFHNFLLSTGDLEDFFGQVNLLSGAIDAVQRFDGEANVEFSTTSTVPEPSSLALFGLAVFGLAFSARTTKS